MRITHTANDVPNAAIPSAYTAGQYNQQWIVKEAAYRQQLQLVRDARNSDPGVLVRTRRKAGILLIRAGVWLCAVSFPARNQRASLSWLRRVRALQPAPVIPTEVEG